MIVNFRQGIISASTPMWLTLANNSVSINGSLLLSFSEQDTDYLYSQSTKSNAWTVPDVNGSYWLFIDMSKDNADISYGYTDMDPFEDLIAPVRPSVGQMYYDKNQYTFMEWVGNGWVSRIRLIVGKIQNGILTKQPLGTQVNLYTYNNADYVVIGTNGLPIKKYTEYGYVFYNKQTITNFNKDRVDNFTFNSVISSKGLCSTAIPSYRCVTWGAYGNLIPASPSTEPAIALTGTDGVTGDLISLVFEGFVENRKDWNWRESVNTPVFVGSNGSITVNPSQLHSIQPIGYIVSPNTIYLNFGEQMQIISHENIVPIPSPSPTPSITPSISVSLSITPSVTSSITVSPTPIISLTPSISVSASATPTPTPTVTISPTPITSLTPSISVSATPSASVSATPTPTITPSITPTITISPTPIITDPYWTSVTSLLHFEGIDGSTVYTDQKGLAWSAGGNAHISTTKSRFGSASSFFDGSGDYVRANDAPSFDFGSGDFTIECFVNPSIITGSGEYRGLITRRAGISNFAFSLFQTQSNGGFSATFSSTGNGNTVVLGPSGALTIDTWYHLAVTRQGSTWNMFVNGVLVSTATSSASIYSGLSMVNLGVLDDGSPSTAYYFNGYIDEVRATKGVARYTTNFTPPSSPFPNS